MSTRPGPRKSTLAGATPTSPATAPAPTPAPAEAKKKLPKVSFYQDADDTTRARAAWFHTQTSEGARTWSEFLRDAVMAETARLEAKYNGGNEWPAMHAKEAPQGRPAGS